MNASTEATERMPIRATGPLIAWAVLAALQATLALVSYFALEDTGIDDPLFTWTFAVGALIQFGILIGFTLAIANAYPDDLGDTLGFRPFAPRWIALAAGVILVSLVLSGVMEIFTDAAEEQGLTPQEWHSDRIGQFAASAVMVVLLGPLAEELFFRGLGVRLLAFAGPAVAIVVTATAFALAHGVPGTFPPLVVFGAGLAWVRLRADSVWPTYVAHAAYNAAALALAAASF